MMIMLAWGEEGNIINILQGCREQRISLKFFRPRFCHGRLRGTSMAQCFCFPGFEGPVQSFWPDAGWPPVVESSIAVDGAVENRGLYRVFFELVLN